MPDSAGVAVLEPLLDLGPETDVVPAHVEAVPARRPRILLSAAVGGPDHGGAPEGSTERDSAASLAMLVHATAAGADAVQRQEGRFTVSVLDVMQRIGTGDFAAANDLVTQYKHSLRPEQKQDRVNAIDDVVQDTTRDADRNQLESLLAVIYQC